VCPAGGVSGRFGGGFCCQEPRGHRCLAPTPSLRLLLLLLLLVVLVLLCLLLMLLMPLWVQQMCLRPRSGDAGWPLGGAPPLWCPGTGGGGALSKPLEGVGVEAPFFPFPSHCAPFQCQKSRFPLPQHSRSHPRLGWH